MEFLNRHKKVFIIIAAILCVISIIATVNYRFHPPFLNNALGFVITPAQKLMTDASMWVGSRTGFFTNKTDLEAENKRLKETVDILSAENRRLKLIEQESKELAELLMVDEKYPDFPKVGARAIAGDSSNWFNDFIINKGTKDGLADNLVVMASGGLVGRIVKASNTYSRVLTIIDDESAVSVKCVRTDDLGLLKGDITLMKSGLCRMDFVDIDAEIMEDDELVTSHLGDIYPPGITVGYVKEVRLDAKALTKYAIVRPTVDFQNIDTVLVISERYNNFGADSLDFGTTPDGLEE